MKNIKYTFLILIFTAFQIFPQWVKLNEGIKGNYPSHLQFINDSIGFTFLYPNIILKTSDFGKSWENLKISSEINLQILRFFNEEVGWIVGTDNMATRILIQKTIDGGLTWETKFDDSYQNWYGLNSFQSLDENHVYGASNDKIISSTDGGNTWKEITPQGFFGQYNNINFINHNLGFVIYFNSSNYDPALLTTKDGGISWNIQQFNNLSYIDKLQFINDSTGYFTASNDSSINFIFKSTDAGKSWVQIYKSDSIAFITLRIKNEQVLYGTTWQGRNNTTSFLKSVDGGKTWNFQNPKFYFYNNEYNFSKLALNEIFFNTNNEGIIFSALGSQITIYTSNDDGNNWYLQKYSCPFIELNFSDSLNGIAFGGYEVGGFHVLDSYGQVFSTDDGGKTWKIISEIPYRIFNAQFVSQNTAYLLTKTGNWGNISKVFKTTDRGKTLTEMIHFEEDFKEYNINANDLCMLDENKGWIVGNYFTSDLYGSIIIETNDGCKNWETVFTSPTVNNVYKRLLSITNVNSTIWAVGENGQVVKYTPQLGWKEISTNISITLEKVFFKDELNGWISGSYYNSQEIEYSLFSTNDGGNSWNKLNNFNYKINDIVFADDNYGIFIGNDSKYNGVIFKTSDGGNNINLVLDNQIGELYDVEISDNNIWVSGNYGLLLKSKDSILTSVDSKNTIPQNFILYQNYPNPFNPATVIEYSIPSNVKSDASASSATIVNVASDFSLRNITLKVYDILGREVATLVNQKQAPGNYKVTFDGHSNLASGIYFYQLKFGDLVDTKKMILLK